MLSIKDLTLYSKLNPLFLYNKIKYNYEAKPETHFSLGAILRRYSF